MCCWLMPERSSILVPKERLSSVHQACKVLRELLACCTGDINAGEWRARKLAQHVTALTVPASVHFSALARDATESMRNSSGGL